MSITQDGETFSRAPLRVSSFIIPEANCSEGKGMFVPSGCSACLLRERSAFGLLVQAQSLSAALRTMQQGTNFQRLTLFSEVSCCRHRSIDRAQWVLATASTTTPDRKEMSCERQYHMLEKVLESSASACYSCEPHTFPQKERCRVQNHGLGVKNRSRELRGTQGVHFSPLRFEPSAHRGSRCQSHDNTTADRSSGR